MSIKMFNHFNRHLFYLILYLINKILNMLNSNEFTQRVTISFGLKNETTIKEEALKMVIGKAKKMHNLLLQGLM